MNGQWQVKNLKFLAEFMNQTGLTTGDIAKGVGLLRNSVTRWFMVDDTTLSRIITAADYYGYDFIISYYCCPLKVSEQRDIHPQCCCNGIADDFSEGKPLS